MNWHSLYEFASKQSIVGVYWGGIQRLGGLKENKPTDDDVLEWMAACQQIAKRNETVTEKSAWVARNFVHEGFCSCLLKGQGNAMLYPDPFSRTPGDIDIWVWPRNGERMTPDEGIRSVIAYCRRFVPQAKACYHHVDFMKAGDVPVEVHYRPSWLNNPFNNRRLQRYFQEQAPEQFGNMQAQGFARPTWDFNVVFQLSHIANHLLHEGIGLRQVIDYYYLLRSQQERRNLAEHEREFRRLGLLPFARALMWMLQQILGLEAELLVAQPDERRGRLLLNEILAGGNFGKFDDRVLSGTYSSSVKKNLQRVVRDLRMMRYFPSESLWEPFFRIWHFYWRKKH